MIVLRIIWITIVCWLASFNFSEAQLERSNWTFGDSTILNFSNQPPSLDSGCILVRSETNCSLSDSMGNLIFYSGIVLGLQPNLCRVFNKEKKQMPNGENIWQSNSGAQGIVALPFPGDSTRYYLFSVSIDWNNYPPPRQHLYFSIIDISLDSGRGDVTAKNQLVNDSLIGNYINIVRHGNGRDFWVIYHSGNPQVINDKFYKLLITPNGIVSTYNQSIGTQIIYATDGQLVFNPSGNMAVFPCSITGVLDLFSFDRCNGDFFNWIPLGDTSGMNIFNSFQGCSFSPDGSKLYASTYDSLFQFDLNATNIKASKVFIDSPKNYSNKICFGHHQLAPNGKIYITNPNNPSVYDTLSTYLGVINNPDSAGLACNYVLAGFSLNAHEAIGLPNLPFYQLGAWQGSLCDTLTGIANAPSVKNQITLMPNPVNSNTFVKFNNSKHEVCLIQLFDVTAKKVFEAKTNENYFQLNCSRFENGFYNAVVIKKSTHDILHAKVIVQH